jgi:hypothetical protein
LYSEKVIWQVKQQILTRILKFKNKGTKFHFSVNGRIILLKHLEILTIIALSVFLVTGTCLQAETTTSEGIRGLPE